MHINQPVSLVPPHFSPGPVSLIYCFCFRVVLLICSHEFAHFQLHLQNILFKFKKIINLKQSKSHCNFKISYRERDNVYLFLHLCYRQQVQNALRNLTPKFGTYWQRTRDKLFFKSFQKGTKTDADSIGSHNLSRYPWAWPFLDIAYYHELNTDRGIEFGVNHRRFNLRDIYPLTYRPFGKHWFPAPRRPISFLSSYYSTKRQRCSSPAYSHALEKSIKSYEKDCRKLMSQYAFVQRCPLRDSRRSGNSTVFCDEYLVDGNGQIIHKIRTVLDPDEIGSQLFTARHDTFKCPS